MARYRRTFSIASLFVCIFVLVFTVGLTVLEYYNLFTNNIYYWTNNIFSWPSTMSYFPFTKFIWNEKLANVGDSFILLIIPLFLFWLAVLLLGVIVELILTLLVLLLILILGIISWLFSTIFALLFLPAVFALGIAATVFCFKRDYSIGNRIICISTNIISFVSTVLFFVLAFTH